MSRGSFLRVFSGDVADEGGPEEAVSRIPAGRGPEAKPVQLDQGLYCGELGFLSDNRISDVPGERHELHEAHAGSAEHLGPTLVSLTERNGCSSTEETGGWPTFRRGEGEVR